MIPERVPIPGSEPPVLEGTLTLGPADPAEVTTVSVVLRPSAAAAEAADPRSLTREQKRERLSADPGDVQAVVEFAGESGLEVLDARPEARTVWLRGSLAALGAAFGVTFERRAHPAGDHRGQVGPVMLPAALGGRVLGVLGLDTRRLFFHSSTARTKTDSVQTMKMTDLAAYFDFPDGDGTGQTIAILEFGGGFAQQDVVDWFQPYGLTVPSVSSTVLPNGSNDGTATPEVMLDITMAGVLAPNAQIAVYFGPWTAQGIYDAFVAATLDGAPVISLSGGAPETYWSSADLACMDQALAAAAYFGATACIASGDSGAEWVAYPASNPWALACGGVEVVEVDGTGTLTTWPHSGGGVSQVYLVPWYQSGAGITPVSVVGANAGGSGRGIPDVAGLATGILLPSGTATGGTSASAPFWAGLVALLNQSLGVPVGFLNATLYGWGQTSSAFTDITTGDNIPAGGTGYSAAVGWDACTGLGTPVGTTILANLQAAAAEAVAAVQSPRP